MKTLIRSSAAIGTAVLVGMVGFIATCQLSGCGQAPAILLKVTADGAVEQYDLYVRDDATGQVIFHSGFNPVLASGEDGTNGSDTRDLDQNPLKIAVKLSKGGTFTLLLVGVAGAIEDGKPGASATQFFWAGRAAIGGAHEVDARLLTVPVGDDQDRDLWPDVTAFPEHVPEAATMYADHLDLLDCDDKMDNPLSGTGMVLAIRAENINPYAIEICGDDYDENCNGNADDACVDQDGDGDPRGDDCDDTDPARHKPTVKDPFPDPPNCCGYSLGKSGTPDEHKSFLGDPMLCPKKRCGDGIDESCRGGMKNDPMNDTSCVVDNDCDGYPAPPMGDDCDDNNPNIYPGALEICGNGINESCSPNGPDSGCVPCDLDGDGYQRNDAAAGCPDSTNQHAGVFDCDDNDAGVYPGATMAAGNKEGGINSQGRIATGIKGLCRRYYEPTGVTGTAKLGGPGYTAGDADCNGVAFEGCSPATCDADGDGWDKDGTCGQTGPFDCNDNDPTIFPGAPDKCGDGVDGNCSGADTPCNGNDKDGDGYLPPADCDDSNPNVHPFALEVCNGLDDDCDGDKDEGNPDPSGVALVMSNAISTCTDSNIGECAKTLGRCVCSPTTPVVSQAAPAMRTQCSGELSGGARVPHCFGAGQPSKQSCEDALVKDDDCDGRVDDPTGTNLLIKGMPCGLTLGVCKPGIAIGCVVTPSKTWYGANPPAGHKHWECSPDTIPAALMESCNGFDDDCDGVLPVNETDPDMDHYIACSPCGPVLASGLLGCGDCDPNVATTHPGAPELCNGVDDDCNPATPDGVTECGAVGKTCCFANGGVCQNLNTDTNYCGACNVTCSGKIFSNVCQAAACICKNQGAACGARNWCDGGNNGGTCTICNTKSHCGDACTPCMGSNVCKSDGSACTGCNVDTDCDASNGGPFPNGTAYCNGGMCMMKKPLGGACSSAMPETPDNECAGTAYCTDGVCCNKPPSMCGGCLQCNLGGAAGTCTNASAGTDPHNNCVANTSTCTGANCNGSGSCYVGDGVACGAQTCVDNATESHTQVDECAANMCSMTPTDVTCGNFRCNGTSCRTSCAADNQCIAGVPFCWSASGGDNKCYAKATAGEMCIVNSDCQNGACIGGICCGTTGGRPASCGGGTATTSCSGGTLTTYTCSGPQFQSCTSASAPCTGNYACQNATTCENNCASDTDCGSAHWCHKAGVGANTCDARITSTNPCNDSNCAVSGCLQCTMGGVGVSCPGGNTCP